LRLGPTGYADAATLPWEQCRFGRPRAIYPVSLRVIHAKAQPPAVPRWSMIPKSCLERYPIQPEMIAP